MCRAESGTSDGDQIAKHPPVVTDGKQQHTKLISTRESHFQDREIAADSDTTDLVAREKETELPQSVTDLEYLAWGRQHEPEHTELKDSIDLPHKSSKINARPVTQPDLPSIPVARALVHFHVDSLKWHHNAIHSPTFIQECEEFWLSGTAPDSLWLALYFSVMSVSSGFQYFRAG